MHKGLKNGLFLSFILIVASSQGCTDVAISGAQAVYNRQNIQNNFNDQYITMQAFKALNIDDHRFKDTNIAIATYNGEVLLAGQAPEDWQRAQAGKIVAQIPDVKHVYNLVTLSNPSSTLQRMSDAWITAKVKAKFIASNDVDASKIKVVTENGTVYLMGIIFPTQADAAVDLASNTDGVGKVVKIFSYLSISKKESDAITKA